ncbi:LPS assembly lipoprotein LptE [Rhizobium sp. C4]|uniref:LPS assembly lipoprotein LptE n=1 Tax=Rhizobium sp. C4 TaxID=1349800 RepID=UPI001E2A5471|nr:LPS assembly lipoprotein LptE [Rhizobium sp. C4]MCD2174704.1 LPS assembly lipoprotein LptE [Rhizobium sp. C4]
MSSFDKPLFRRAFVGAVLAASALGLSACQVQPLYGKSGLTDSLASVGISEPKNRVEQSVRNQMIFLLSGGAGEPANPVYQLELHVSSSNVNYLSQISSNLPQPGRVTLSARYILTRDGKLIKQGTQRMDAQLDYTSQQFAQIRAIRDAEDRAARELAEVLKLDIAAALSK